MYSASQDNTFFNSWARGLQVGGKTNADYSHLVEGGKMVANLAKAPLKKAKDMQLSEYGEEIRQKLQINVKQETEQKSATEETITDEEEDD